MGLTSRVLRWQRNGKANSDIYVVMEVDGKKVSRGSLVRRAAIAAKWYPTMSSLPDEDRGVWRRVAMNPRDHVTEHKLCTLAQTPDAAMAAFVEERMDEVLPANMPPWHVYSLYHDGREPNYILLRVDHAVADGRGLVAMLSQLADDPPSPGHQENHKESPPADPAEGSTRGLATAVALVCVALACARSSGVFRYAIIAGATLALLRRRSCLAGTYRAPVGLLRWLYRAIAQDSPQGEAPWPKPERVFDERRRVAKTRPFPLGLVKEVGKVVGTGRRATVSDIMLGLVAGATRRYAEHHGRALGPNLRATVIGGVGGADQSTNIRRLRGARGENEICAHTVRLPFCRAESVTDRSRGAQRAMLSAKRRSCASALRSAKPWLGRMEDLGLAPVVSSLARFVAARLTNADITATTLQGPGRECRMRGRRISSVYSWTGVPVGTGPIMVMLSYNGHITVCCSAAKSTLPDPERLMRCMEEEFDALVEAADGNNSSSSCSIVKDEHMKEPYASPH